MGIFGKAKGSSAEGVVDSIIGEKAKFKGELISRESVSVSGEFEGKISAKADVIIARGSKITGDVQGGNVTVSGKVDGNIFAAQSLEITKSGRVHGDLVGGKINIEEGASYRGKVRVEGKAEEEGEEKEETKEEEVEEEGEEELPEEEEPYPKKASAQSHMF